LAIDRVGQRLIRVFKRSKDGLQLQRLRRVRRESVEGASRNDDLGELKATVAVQARPALWKGVVGKGIEPQRLNVFLVRFECQAILLFSADGALLASRTKFYARAQQSVVRNDPAWQCFQIRPLGFERDRFQCLPARYVGLFRQLRRVPGREAARQLVRRERMKRRDERFVFDLVLLQRSVRGFRVNIQDAGAMNVWASDAATA